MSGKFRVLISGSGTLLALLLLAFLVPWFSGSDLATVEKTNAHRWSQVRDDGLPVRAPNPWFFAERAYPQGKIPREAWQLAQVQAAALRTEAVAEAEAATARDGAPDVDDWQDRGPYNVGGRITGVAVDPTDENVVYAGCADGGVLRSTDGGTTWIPVFDDQPTLAVGAVAIDPQAHLVIYAGTGEVNPGGGSVAYGGAGVFRSEDGGDTWQAIGLESVGSIGRIVIDPTDSDRIFVAATGLLWESGPDRGVYRTTDGGASWDRVHYVDETTGCVDIIQRPDQPDVLLAAMWQHERRPEAYDYGGPGCAVWRSDDGGDSWSPVGGGLPTPGNTGGRIGLSLCAAQPEVMHAVYADRVGYFDGLYRSTNGGVTWTRTNDGGLSGVFASYGWWFGNVRTHPLDPDVVFVLGLDFYRSVNGGLSYQEVSGGMHVDHHGLAFGSGIDPVIYAGNDGGMYRSTNGGSQWTFSPDQPITQVYRLGLATNNPAALYVGAQDNGTNRTLTGQLDDWGHIFGGDGFQPLIHPVNNNLIWCEYQYGGLYHSSNGGNSFNYALNGVGGDDRIAWNMPLVQDPTDPDVRYIGTHRLYRSDGNTSWTPISNDLTGGPHQNQNGQVRGTLTTIAVSPLDGDVLWTGSDDGHVYRDAGGIFGGWRDVSEGLPERWITAVRCDPLDRETAYVTVSGFRWSEPLPHVYRTTDLGMNWEPIAGNLPEAPANDIFIDPSAAGHYYVATDVGVYRTRDGGVTWTMLGTDLPSVVITHFGFQPETRTLFAATYGRGVFTYVLSDPVSAAPDGPWAAGNDAGRMLAPYPNPASGGTTIAFAASRDLALTVDVYNVAGRKVWSHRTDATAGATATLRWDGRDANGRPVASGVYLAQVSSAGRILGRETVVLRK